jgi:hypothetical protein
VVDPQSSSPVQIPQTLTWRHHSWRVLSSSGDTDLSMTLRDKDGSSPVEGIYPVLESVAKAPNGQFAIGRNLTFTFNGVPVWSDLNKGQNADPPAGNPLPANIVAGGHAIVGMHLQDLATGEYDATIRFRAANSTDDDAQKFHFVVDVHAPLIAALAAVLGALLLSFVGTKIVAFKKKSLDLQQRIAALNSVWLKNEQPFVPIVYARAILNQCDELSRRFWLSGADVVEDRLTKVTALIGVLDQARQIRQGIEHIGQSSFVRVRATATLSRVIENMGANCMDDKVLAATKAILDGFADWTKPDHMEAAYWAAFAPWGATLAAAVRLEAISDRAARELMQGLLDRLNSALKEPPSGIDAKVGVEKNFAFLKILWDRRRAEAEFNELADKIRTNCDYDDVFKCADDAAWKRVESLGKGKLRILPPESGSAEAYAPITFRVTTGDPELDETVLFKHRLRFQWTIEIAPKTHFWSRGRSRKVPPLTPATYQPEVVQYSPTAGTISATVRVCRGPDEAKSDQQDLVISPSSDFRLLRGFETTEMLSFTITGIVAALTGIMTFYLKNPTFGSLQDYLTIGLWGLSADQTKNALQSYFGISKS